MKVTAMSDAEVMLQFESLGDSCEFGFAQRALGAEPVSLLRWGGAPLAGLVAGLRAGFAGLYRREDLLVISDNLVTDSKYDLRFHCGPYLPDAAPLPQPVPETAAAAALHAREARHVRFLLRNTMENLQERARVFVYKLSAGMKLSEMLQLKSALDLYGPQRLFCVLPAGPALAAGEVRLMATGVKVGGIARFAPYTNQQAADAQAWLALCRRALAGVWGDERLVVAAVRGEATLPGETMAARAREAVTAAEAALEAEAAAVFEPTAQGVVVRSRSLARGVVTALYRTLLLRMPDEAGLAAHVAVMVEGEKAVEDVVEAMLRSAEFAGLRDAFLQRYAGPAAAGPGARAK